VFLSRQSTVAVVVECGGTGSHAALLTRALGIPAVGQISNLFDHLHADDLLLIDGSQGIVTVSPDADTRASFERRMQKYKSHLAEAKEHCHEPAATPDGIHVEVLANITGREDAEQALENGADGIGLYRLESFYLSQKVFPTEQALFAELEQTLMPVKHLPITIRLLDIGGDKNFPFLNLPHEENPFLGRRGVRLLLAYPDLLETQLQVLLTLSQQFDLRILVPMITIAEDMARVRELYTTLANEVGIDSPPPLGAMIETPAAALGIETLRQYADFFSIGTNDLTQYTMAAGRENALINTYFQDDHPVIMRLTRLIVEQAGDTPISLCGELAGKIEALSDLLDAGLRSVSVAPPLIPIIKQHIRHL
jgi:phosphotransferase system enzyme I (PtsI)